MKLLKDPKIQKVLIIVVFAICYIIYAQFFEGDSSVNTETDTSTNSETAENTYVQNTDSDNSDSNDNNNSDSNDNNNSDSNDNNNTDTDETREYKEYTFRNNKLYVSHFEKHGDEVGASSKEEYLEMANKVINNPDVLHKIEEEDGDDVYFLEETGEFVIVSTDGYIRTYYIADLAYFNRQ